VVKKGKLVLQAPLPLADGTEVQIHVKLKNSKPSVKKTDVDPLLWAAEHAVDTGLTDMADEHDHYIYGTPKRKKRSK
jgi:hypothetical protein